MLSHHHELLMSRNVRNSFGSFGCTQWLHVERGIQTLIVRCRRRGKGKGIKEPKFRLEKRQNEKSINVSLRRVLNIPVTQAKWILSNRRPARQDEKRVWWSKSRGRARRRRFIRRDESGKSERRVEITDGNYDLEPLERVERKVFPPVERVSVQFHPL